MLTNKVKISPKHYEFLNMLSDASRDKYGKYCLACYDPNWQHKSQIYNTNPLKLIKYADTEHNFYLSENQFSKDRSIKNVKDLDTMFCDCDCLKNGISINTFLSYLPNILKRTHLPHPCVKKTGHGLHLVYVINQIICRKHTKKGKNLIQYWNNTEHFILEKLQVVCIHIFGKPVIDMGVHDEARVLRLADTFNHKDREPLKCKWISIYNHIYNLGDFWDHADKKTFPKLYKYYRHHFAKDNRTSKKSNFRSSPINYFHKFNSNKYKRTKEINNKGFDYYTGFHRVGWLLSELRRKHYNMFQHRDLFLLILGRELLKIHPNHAMDAVHTLSEINQKLQPAPLGKTGLNKIIGEMTGQYNIADIRKYNYSTRAICTLLNISIHPTNNTLLHRMHIKQIHYQQKLKQDKHDYKRICYLLRHNYSKSATAQRIHRSRHYINNVINRQTKYRKIQSLIHKQHTQLHLSQKCNHENTVRGVKSIKKNLTNNLDELRLNENVKNDTNISSNKVNNNSHNKFTGIRSNNSYSNNISVKVINSIKYSRIAPKDKLRNKVNYINSIRGSNSNRWLMRLLRLIHLGRLSKKSISLVSKFCKWLR